MVENAFVLNLALLTWQTQCLRWREFRLLLRCLDQPVADLPECVAHILGRESRLSQFLNTTRWLEQNQAWQNWGERQRVRFLYPTHRDYPSTFFHLEEPPLALGLDGQACWHNKKCLSIVGSREPHRESLMWMERELGLLFSKRALATISGGARGIDQKCHGLSLQHERPTLIVVPAGLARLYPPTLSRWRDYVLEGGGGFLSACAPFESMRKGFFERRNQLIAQLGDALLIVEAARRSGSSMTGRLALEREKPIGIVPGHPLDRNFQGSLDLIANGATLIRDADDLAVLF